MAFDSSFWVTFLLSIAGSNGLMFVLLNRMSNHLGDRWLARHESELQMAVEDHKHVLVKDLEDYRADLDRKRAEIEGKFEANTHAAEAHFQQQLEALRVIFTDLGKLRLAFNGVRQRSSSHNAAQKARDLRRQLENFKVSCDRFADTAETQKIFVPDELVSQLTQCLEIAQAEVLDIENSEAEAFSPAWNEKGEKNRGRFTVAYEAAHQLTRRHLPRSPVLPDSQAC